MLTVNIHVMTSIIVIEGIAGVIFFWGPIVGDNICVICVDIIEGSTVDNVCSMTSHLDYTLVQGYYNCKCITHWQSRLQVLQ